MRFHCNISIIWYTVRNEIKGKAMKKTIKIVSMPILGLLLTACKSAAPVIIPDSPSFKKGKHDGCETSKGTYTKRSKMFRNNADYQNGWFYGRQNCHLSNMK